jgi:hypothetical protein
MQIHHFTQAIILDLQKIAKNNGNLLSLKFIVIWMVFDSKFHE